MKLKLLCLLLVAVFVLGAFVSCTDEELPSENEPEQSSASTEQSQPDEQTSEEPSQQSSEESSVEVSEEISEETSVEVKTYFDFLKTAKSVGVDVGVTGESVVVFTNSDSIATGNCLWSTNVLLKKTTVNYVYEVVSVAAGNGTAPDVTLGEGEILLAVHSDGESENKDGKAAAATLTAGTLIAIVGIEEKDAIVVKEYEEGEELVYKKSLPEGYLTQFAYFGASPVYAAKASDSNTIGFTKINEDPAFGDSILYTVEKGAGAMIGSAETDFSDYGIVVVTYTHITTDGVNNFRYHVTNYYTAEDTSVNKSQIKIPDDGFVIAVHKAQEKYYGRLANIKSTDMVYVMGVQVKPINYSLFRLEGNITIDGTIEDTWDAYLVDEIDENNVNWDYSQFALNDYGRTANIYATYDDENIYFAVQVESASCDWMPSAKKGGEGNGMMYAYESIQFNLCDQSSISEYMVAHCSDATDQTARNENHIRQYGFCGNKNNETCYIVWWGGNHVAYTGQAAVLRHEDTQETVYEFTVPWTEANIDPEEVKQGFEFSFSFSINSSKMTSEGNQGTWQNIKMRDGGGIIGMNEFTKMPVVTIED